MDPITTSIVIALAKLSEKAIYDAYEALKQVIFQKCGEDSEVGDAIKVLEPEKTPSARQQAKLAAAVGQAGLDKEPQILKLAARLDKLVNNSVDNHSGSQMSIKQKGNQNIGGVSGSTIIINN